MNNVSSLREKSSVYADAKTKTCQVVLLLRFFFTPRCHFSLLSWPSYRCELEYKVVWGYVDGLQRNALNKLCVSKMVTRAFFSYIFISRLKNNHQYKRVECSNGSWKYVYFKIICSDICLRSSPDQYFKSIAQEKV